MKSKREVSVVNTHILCKPKHFAHIERKVGQIVNGVRRHKRVVERFGRVSYGIIPVSREAFGYLLVKGRTILSRRINLGVCNIARWSLMVGGDEPI